MDENLSAMPGNAREDTFDTAVRGYHRGQVQEYMSRSSQMLATLEQHLAVARADAKRASDDARAVRLQLERVQAEQAQAKPAHEEVSGRLSQILKLAAEEADQERANAEAEIAQLRAESTAESQRMLAQARDEADQLMSEARQTAERELAEARATAERELTNARQEADRLRLASVRQTQELLDEARRRAGAVNQVSNHRLETLTATHGEAVMRLSQIRDVLADLLQRDTAAGSLSDMVEAALSPPQDLSAVEDTDLLGPDPQREVRVRPLTEDSLPAAVDVPQAPEAAVESAPVDSDDHAASVEEGSAAVDLRARRARSTTPGQPR